MLERYKQLVIRILFLTIIPLISTIHVALNTYRAHTKSLETGIDKIIPFVPAFVIPYAYWFPYVFIALIFLAVKDGKKFYGLLSSIVFGMLFSFVIFLYFPTTVVRPEIIGSGFFNSGMKVVYGMDNPYNCFPSIHVLNSMLCCMFLYSYNKSFWFNVWNVGGNVLIILSTMFIKQHVILDAVAGILISWIMFSIFSKEQVWIKKQYQRLLEIIQQRQAQKDNPDIT